MKNRQHRNLALIALLLGSVMIGSSPAFARGKKPKHIVLRGLLVAVSATSATVNGTLIALTNRTKYEDFFGGSTSLAAFKVGDCVKVKLLPTAKTATAREMELEDSCGASAQPPVSATPPADDSRRPSVERPDDDSRDDDSRDDDDRQSSEDGDDRGRGRGRGRGR